VSARSKARKQALDLLYESDIRGTDLLQTLLARDVVEEGPDARPIRDYTKELVNGVAENRRKIDELITTYAQGWDMDRLPAVDRNILRLGIFEILWSTAVPISVAIDSRRFRPYSKHQGHYFNLASANFFRNVPISSSE
jgi:N utilization substance protein B